MRDKMRKWREENCRNSEQIVEVGEELIHEYASKLGDDSRLNSFMSIAFLFLFLFHAAGFVYGPINSLITPLHIILRVLHFFSWWYGPHIIFVSSTSASVL